MNETEILDAMRQRMFTPELTNSLLAAYWKELEEEDEEDEIEFQRSHRILEEKLTPVQKDILRDMEVLCAKNVDYALEFAFHRGVYISFEQLFVENTEKHPFTELVCSKILHNPEKQTLFPYASTRDQFNQCASLLEEHWKRNGGSTSPPFTAVGMTGCMQSCAMAFTWGIATACTSWIK